MRSNLDIRLTAPLAVRGGKNSSENQRSPDSILLRILSRSLSDRYASSTGVEHRELSLELSPPLLLAPLESLLHDCQVASPRWTWFTMMATYTQPLSPAARAQMRPDDGDHAGYASGSFMV